MNKKRLIKNIVDQVMEAQLKLGYARESLELYYPLSSLNALLETEITDVPKMRDLLVREYSDIQGIPMKFTIHAGRIAVGIGPQGAEYVHEKVPVPAFLKELIALMGDHCACSLEEIRALFERYGKCCMEKMPEGSDFDAVLFFEDPSVDEYYYCIKTEEMGHTIYHRFIREDYLEIRSEVVR